MTWSDTTRKRLEMLIPKLASDQDGEVIATVRAIRKALINEKSDLHDLAKRIGGEPTIVYKTVFKETAQRPKSDWQAKADYCVEHADSLRDREVEFVHDMAVKLKYQGEPSDKQAAWLDSIYQRLERQYGATG